MRQSACLVINPITFDKFAALFNCTPVDRVRVSVTFHLTCVHINFTFVSVAEWLPFGKYILTRLTLCSLCVLTICNISYFPFWL